MIQRIQTVFLAIAAILTLVPMALQSTLATAGDFYLTSVGIYSTHEELHQVGSSFGINIAMAIGLLLSVYAIMQYKNRKFQMKLVQGALLVQLAVGGVVFYYADQMAALANPESVSYSPLLAILLVNVVLYFLAYRGIKKDDELVRSADRLR